MMDIKEFMRYLIMMPNTKSYHIMNLITQQHIQSLYTVLRYTIRISIPNLIIHPLMYLLTLKHFSMKLLKTSVTKVPN